MDFSWGATQGPPALWTLDLGLVSQVGPIPTPALHSLNAEDFEGGLQATAGWGGAALALAAWKITPGAGLALVVGQAVRAGQATASRASVIARSPLTGHLNQAQVGTDLARRLGALCDGLLLCGATRVSDAVLVLHSKSGFHLESVPGVKSMGTRRSARELRERFGDCSVLRPGPAAHAGVRWSNLCAGQEPASFVGSGGLGAVLASMGLAALVVCAEPVEPARELDGWLQSLVRSPRLIARAQGQSLQEESRTTPQPKELERHGCSGCPTPCGFVFERPDRGKGNARFSALRPLMELAGDPGGQGIQGILQACNDLGVDAREAAACLQLFLRHEDRKGLELPELLKRLCSGEMGPPAFREGAVSLAQHYGASIPESHDPNRKQLHVADPAQRLAQCLGVRGAEPLRSYPFLVGHQADANLMRELVAPLALPPGSELPESEAGKGRLLWWHENLICGVDVLGVCAFTVAALLSDGVSDLSELAGRILPDGFQVPGSRSESESLLAVGANTLLLFRELDFAGRPDGAAVEDMPAALHREGEQYLLLRGLRPDGWPAVDPMAQLGRAEWTRTPLGMTIAQADLGPETPRLENREQGSHVGIELRFLGALEPRLGAGLCLLFQSEPTLTQALQVICTLFPRNAHWLLSQDRPVPAVMREGEVLTGGRSLRHGDVLDLILAISGG
ncbi:MAG: aldehyde:ferredoxin oxidoreductase [Planctomycetota bacterium]|jgi:aldehyde:ferredoxin oxidoreductase